MRKTIGLDVDAVLAQYDGVYVPGRIGPPMSGAKEAIAKLRENYDVILYTARDLDDIHAWTTKHKIDYDGYEQKPVMFASVSARWIQFHGHWKHTLKELENFRPWYVSDKPK